MCEGHHSDSNKYWCKNESNKLKQSWSSSYRSFFSFPVELKSIPEGYSKESSFAPWIFISGIYFLCPKCYCLFEINGLEERSTPGCPCPFPSSSFLFPPHSPEVTRSGRRCHLNVSIEIIELFLEIIFSPRLNIRRDKNCMQLCYFPELGCSLGAGGGLRWNISWLRDVQVGNVRPFLRWKRIFAIFKSIHCNESGATEAI